MEICIYLATFIVVICHFRCDQDVRFLMTDYCLFYVLGSNENFRYWRSYLPSWLQYIILYVKNIVQCAGGEHPGLWCNYRFILVYFGFANFCVFDAPTVWNSLCR